MNLIKFEGEHDMPSKIIGVMGNVASGKTTFTKALGNVLGVPYLEEKVENNIFLELFYQNPDAWAFQSKMWFLQYRFQTYLQARNGDGLVIVDGTIWDDLAHALAYLEGHNLDLYKIWYKAIVPFAQCNAIIFLQAPLEEMFSRVQLRDRSVETSTDENRFKEYLSNLDIAYEQALGFVQTDHLIKFNTYQVNYLDTDTTLQPVIAFLHKNHLL